MIVPNSCESRILEEKGEGGDMTVCVAVLCQNGAGAIGASDRMVSTADNQTRRVKVHHLTDRVAVMIAGDVAIHAELLIEVRRLIALNLGSPEVLTVKNIADSYASAYFQARQRRAERDILAPLGLDMARYNSDQAQLSQKLVSDLATELLQYRMPGCSAIFIGVDESAGYNRAHLYTMDDGRLTCCDESGFACIGVGMYQAMSSLMFSGIAAENSLEKALYLTYVAKRRAEVAPGVGQETDMIYAIDQRYIDVHQGVLGALERIYMDAEIAHQAANSEAERQCHDFIQTLGQAPSDDSQEQLAPPGDVSDGEPAAGAPPTTEQ